MSLLQKALVVDPGRREAVFSIEEIDLALEYLEGRVTPKQVAVAIDVKVTHNAFSAAVNAWLVPRLRNSIKNGDIEIKCLIPNS